MPTAKELTVAGGRNDNDEPKLDRRTMFSIYTVFIHTVVLAINEEEQGSRGAVLQGKLDYQRHLKHRKSVGRTWEMA